MPLRTKPHGQIGLHLLEFAYNSTGDIPYMLLYGFVPKNPLDFLLPNKKAR
jgi:hypothetical protein